MSDVDETVEQLHTRGIQTSDIRVKKNGRLAFFHDPDGNELCLWEYARGQDAREIVKSALLHG